MTLFEKEDTLGGTMNLADKGPHKEKITRFVETMKAEVERAGVKVLLGKAPSIDEVKALAPEGVVMAAGAAPIVPRIPGVDKPHVLCSRRTSKPGRCGILWRQRFQGH